MMSEPSALSPAVHDYLARLRGTPGFFVAFLSSQDFRKMQEIAKDFGGIDIVHPEARSQVRLNAFGVITFKSENGGHYAITRMGPDEDEPKYLSRAREFILGLREWVFPEWDSYGCTQTLIQSCYDSVTAEINRVTSHRQSSAESEPPGSKEP